MSLLLPLPFHLLALSHFDLSYAVSCLAVFLARPFPCRVLHKIALPHFHPHEKVSQDEARATKPEQRCILPCRGGGKLDCRRSRHCAHDKSGHDCSRWQAANVAPSQYIGWRRIQLCSILPFSGRTIAASPFLCPVERLRWGASFCLSLCCSTRGEMQDRQAGIAPLILRSNMT